MIVLKDEESELLFDDDAALREIDSCFHDWKVTQFERNNPSIIAIKNKTIHGITFLISIEINMECRFAAFSLLFVNRKGSRQRINSGTEDLNAVNQVINNLLIEMKSIKTMLEMVKNGE